MHLLENPDWQLLDLPSVNDIVDLKIEDIRHYMVRIIIIKIEDYIIIGKVNYIYDLETRTQVNNSRIDSLFDDEQEFQRTHIFKIIKNNPSIRA